MKKNRFILPVAGFFLVFFIMSCGTEADSSSHDIAYVDSMEMKHDSIVEDSVLEAGTVPEGWVKQSLDKGYYIAFIKEPKIKKSTKRKRRDFTVSKKEFVQSVSLTDISEEPVFKENRKEKTHFYDAVFRDFLMSIDEEANVVQILLREEFLFLNIYPAALAEIQAEDFKLHMQCVIIGQTLYTFAFIIWDEETDELLQIKNYFFNSLGKELVIE